LNPAGTSGIADGGRGTTRETFVADAVAPGFGKSPGRISLLTPGLSERQSPNAAAPVSGPVCADTPPMPAKSAAAAHIERWAARMISSPNAVTAAYCNPVSPLVRFFARSISVTAIKISARVFRSGASSIACFSAVP
jgi:hypothetical protein